MSDAPLDPELLRALPIFPLRDAILLPQSIVPLHVFEPRYRAMVQDVVRGGRHLALARLEPGFEAAYDGRPAVAPVVGVGRLLAAEELDDGRFHILLAGVARARIERELPPTRIYREVEARVLVDAPADAAALADLHGRLTSVCDRLADLVPEGGRELRQISRVAGGPAAACDRVAGLLVTDADQRQALLEEIDPMRRGEEVLDHASRLLIAMSKVPDGPLH